MKTKFLVYALSTLILTIIQVVEAQQTKVPRIGVLGTGTAQSQRREAFRQGLRDLRYVEGQNIVIEYRHAEGNVERLPDLAAELVRLKVDVIIVDAQVTARAAMNVTKTIPIVMSGIGVDPVDVGLVASLARPGGNVTGLTAIHQELSGKRLELLKEAFPKVSRVAVLWKSRGSRLSTWFQRDPGGCPAIGASASIR
jgi:putative tryptophan/tyrosine transport system substrate-binding protein